MLDLKAESRAFADYCPDLASAPAVDLYIARGNAKGEVHVLIDRDRPFGDVEPRQHR